MADEPLRRLAGQTVFLSASVPDQERDERFRQIADAPFQIEQAVVSLARAVLSEGGRLVFGGHPSISPLVAFVAGDYRAVSSDGTEPAPQVAIYQSEVFRGVIPRDTDLLIRLGLAEVHWTPPMDGEVFVTGQGSAAKQCPSSLHEMRRRMIEETSPVAMVCIGGMEGVLVEAGLFGDRGPIFVLACTGGAAAILADDDRGVIAIDRDGPSDMLASRGDLTGEDDIEVIPYPLIMQTITDRIARSIE